MERVPTHAYALTYDVRVSVKGEHALARHMRRMTASRSMPAARGRRAGGGGGGRLRVAGRSSRIGIGSGSGDVDDAAGIAVRLVHRLLGPPAALLHSTIGRRPVLDDRSASTAAFGANTSDDAQSARLQARRIGELAPRTGRRRWSLVAGMAAVAQRAARDARIDGTGPRRRGGGAKSELAQRMAEGRCGER